jgi:GTP diphosphokinase / guanosine-3',5'-bis(diphosphate) 3'-diphosphatase
VEVVTAKDAFPSRDWLSVVKTARARGKIKHWINQREKEDASELGKKLMEKEARKFKTTWKKVLLMEGLNGIVSEYGIQKPEEIYAAVGFGKIAPRQILSPLFPDQSPPAEGEKRRLAIPAVVRRVFHQTGSAITVKGQDNLLVYRAKCCNPIRGDDIVGYITRGKGISVHTTACPNLANYFGSERMTEVEWVNNSDEEVFSVGLEIRVEDRQGILAEITSAISNLKTNIRESRSTSDNELGKGTVEITVDISDTKHLQRVIQGLKTIRGIQEVERVHRIPGSDLKVPGPQK